MGNNWLRLFARIIAFFFNTDIRFLKDELVTKTFMTSCQNVKSSPAISI